MSVKGSEVGGKSIIISFSFPSFPTVWEQRAHVGGQHSQSQHQEVTEVPPPGAAQGPPACLRYSTPVGHTPG